jgi:hypothetical protein
MKIVFGLLCFLVAASPARAEDDFAKAIYGDIENNVRDEYGAMAAAITRELAANPPQDEAEQAKRAEQLERELERMKLFAYNKAVLFSLCAGDADRARSPGAPPMRADQSLVLRTCVEIRLDQLRKFSNVAAYAATFFPERIEPCGERARLPEREKAMPPYEFLKLKDPKLYDFERYTDCLMTPR